MEALTVSLETAKKLRAAGFPQEVAMWWGERPTYDDQPDEWQLWTEPWADRECFAAPTAQEIADQLPRKIEDEQEEAFFLYIVARSTGNWEVGYSHIEAEEYPLHDTDGDTMAEALA